MKEINLIRNEWTTQEPNIYENISINIPSLMKNTFIIEQIIPLKSLIE